jgi:uncharacterized protein involved in copper resistance
MCPNPRPEIGAGGDRVPRLGQRWGEAEGAMGAPTVVVLDVDAECLVEMSSTKVESPVEALAPHHLDHALGGVPSRAAGTVTRSPLVRTLRIAQIVARARQEGSLDQPTRGG